MENKRTLCLFFLVLILIFSSCHPRLASDIKPGMTKEKVISSWGQAGSTSYNIVKGKTIETWEYYFPNSNSICSVDFLQNTVVASECRKAGGGWLWQGD